MTSVILTDSKGYYATLGVPERASYQEIKKAYRRLARKYHPDRNGSGAGEEMIKKINAAYEVLSDENKRAQYDKTGFGDDTRDVDAAPADDQYTSHFSNAAPAQEEQPKTEKVKPKKEYAYDYYGPTYIETPKSRFHIIVEPSLCMAFGSCETLAPKVFVVEKNKRVNPKAWVESETGADFDTIYAAAQTCPTKAIKIVDRYTGEQIFP